ncbi:MAG: DUF5685 family protein [Clostridia bacterium]|nr:DUF5685 family protein [Clostridia bacterium]
MFGYINPDRPNLFIKDETLYNAVYCGVCKCIGKECGQICRTTLTYDMAFMSALLHNIMHEDFVVRRRRCIAHWFRRRPMAATDDTTMLLGALNCALAYFKLVDDKRDGDKKGFISFLYRNGFKRSLKKHPAACEIISSRSEELAALEEGGCGIIDMVCEPNAKMIEELSRYVLGTYATEFTDGLCYAIGKWIYLADALDDYDSDAKKGRYNVFRQSFGNESKEELVEKNGEEIKFIFDQLFADMRENLTNIKFYYNHDLTDNIILQGIPAKSRNIFYGQQKDVCDEQKQS